MKCKNIQELLLTDYIDGEISEELKEKVKKHIQKCEKCKEFEQALIKGAIDPIKQVGIENPPEYVWTQIQDRIQGEKKEIEVPISQFDSKVCFFVSWETPQINYLSVRLFKPDNTILNIAQPGVLDIHQIIFS